jgi:hypothetical protein
MVPAGVPSRPTLFHPIIDKKLSVRMQPLFTVPLLRCPRFFLLFADEVRALDVFSVHPRADAVNAGQLRWAKSRGMQVYPWVVKARETLKAFRASGYVDGVMVNDLALFSEH